jgi:anti-anti-sigma factor
LHIEVVERDGSLILRVEGEIDIASAPSLDAELERAQGSGAEMIVVDLDQVEFIDSTGLHVLIRHSSLSSQNGGRLRFTEGSEQVQRLFRLTGTMGHLPFLKA